MEDTQDNKPQKEIPDSKDEQIDKLELLQDLVLDDYIKLARSNGLTATDRANLQRWFMANGLELDRRRVPQELKDTLTRKVSITDDLPVEADAPAAPRLRAMP